MYLGVSRYQDCELLHSRLNKDVKQIIQIQILETLDLYSLMILFLFSSYHLSVSDTSAARTPTAVAAAPTGLTLFSSNLLLLHTLYQQQLREKRVRARRSSSSSSRTTCRSLTIQLLLQALALPPFLPSFPKTFSTPSDQSSIWLESTDGQISQWKKIFQF